MIDVLRIFRTLSAYKTRIDTSQTHLLATRFVR